jgi:hypothetical protein
VADRPDEDRTPERAARPTQPPADLADEVERARTPRTPLFALTGVVLTLAVAFVLILAVVLLTLHFT